MTAEGRAVTSAGTTMAGQVRMSLAAAPVSPAQDGGSRPAGRPGTGLSERLTAVARLVQIGSARAGPDGFSPELMQDSRDLLARAGERLRLSAEHTIVVLAGGTGSGKSSLFNLMAGANFSPVGAVRPVTREPHACVWGMEGAGPLLDWLQVPPRHRYARSSALDDGERSMAGLLLLDLPDHDSVLSGSSGEVGRLIGLADLMVWVLDPQKYADAALHSRFLVPMASHSAVMGVVLNQVDLLAPDQVDDCEADLRRLLDSEGLHDARVVVTSAATGHGLADLRKMLVETVLDREAALTRIAADVDALAARFVPYSDEPAGAETPGAAPGRPELSASSGHTLSEAFAAAAGVPGVARALQSARELKAVDHVGWPVFWLADRVLRRDPVRKIRLGALWDELRGVSAASAGAQQADVDNAITVLADKAGESLPDPWRATVRGAARSRAADVPAALGAAIAEALPAENAVVPWWRLAAAGQGLLLGVAATGLAWLAALILLGGFGLSPHAAPMLRDLALIPWVTLMVAAVLGLGWLAANGCMVLAAREAGREREQAEEKMRAGLIEVAQRMVIAPVERELSEYVRFRDEVAVACGQAH